MTKDEWISLVKWHRANNWDHFNRGSFRDFRLEYWGKAGYELAVILAEFEDGKVLIQNYQISSQLTPEEAQLIITKLNLLNPATPK